jgi:hypothetical protein
MLYGALLIGMAIKQPYARLGALGLIAYLAGFGLVALAVGWGRSGLAPYYCLDSRYALLSVPALCGIYLGGNLLEPSWPGRLLQWVLFTAMCLAMPANFEEGRNSALSHRRGTQEFIRDVQRGVPVQLLIKRHHWLVPSWSGEAQPEFENIVLDRWRLLRQAGIGVFKDLREFPAYRRIDVHVNPRKGEPMTWEKNVGHGLGSDSKATFALDGLQHVLAIRIRCSMDGGSAAGPADFQVSWKGRTQGEQSERLSIDAAPGEKVLTAWVDDWIDQFTIHCDNACKILRLGMLVPSAGGASQEGRHGAGEQGQPF